MTTHGERRIGLLTSSVAHVVMHGSTKAWEALRCQMWAEKPEDFDNKVTTGPRAYGHEHEAEGAAKFWERHPEYELEDGGFHTYKGDGPLKGWLGSSPDRLVTELGVVRHGLEIKSPTSPESFANHGLVKHYDQCQHGMLVTGLPTWWLVVHHGEMYAECFVSANPAWQVDYLHKAQLFHRFVYEGRDVKRRKLSASDMID
jgi:hypothetical protein